MTQILSTNSLVVGLAPIRSKTNHNPKVALAPIVTASNSQSPTNVTIVVDSFPGQKVGFTYKGSHNGHYYYLSKFPTSPLLAMSYTDTIIGHLVTISSIEENNLLSQKSRIMATYFLCGFANFLSIGIQIGGISVLAPNGGEIYQIGDKMKIKWSIKKIYDKTIDIFYSLNVIYGTKPAISSELGPPLFHSQFSSVLNQYHGSFFTCVCVTSPGNCE